MSGFAEYERHDALGLADLVRRRLHQPGGARYPGFRQEWRIIASPPAFRLGQFGRKRRRFPSVSQLEDLGGPALPGMELGAQ